MEKEPLIRLTWRGQETVQVIPGLLDKAEQIEIALPANYNHALFRALNPQAPPSALEEIDASAGADLLNDIATIHGLEELAALASTLRDAGARVRLVSPPTLVISVPSADAAQN